jgi:hypothetical protein
MLGADTILGRPWAALVGGIDAIRRITAISPKGLNFESDTRSVPGGAKVTGVTGNAAARRLRRRAANLNIRPAAFR